MLIRLWTRVRIKRAVGAVMLVLGLFAALYGGASHPSGGVTALCGCLNAGIGVLILVTPLSRLWRR